MSHGNHRRVRGGSKVQHPTTTPPARRGWPLVGTSHKALKPPALSALAPGTVVLAQVPYAEESGWKTRPAVILTVGDRSVGVQPVTSSSSRSDFGCLELVDWAQAGLSRPCALMRRSVDLDRRLDLISVVGQLSARDWQSCLNWLNNLERQREAAAARELTIPAYRAGVVDPTC